MPIADEEKYKRVRYSIINAGIGATAKVVHDAVKIKSWAGSSCYALAGIATFLGGIDPNLYRLSIYNEVDGAEKLSWSKDVTSLIFAIHNGRFAGGGMAFTPACLMNDGLLDVSYYDNVAQLQHIYKIMNSILLKGGIHAYEKEWRHLRGSKIVMENLNFEPDSMKDPLNPKFKKSV